MTHKIFRSIFISTICALALSFVLIFGVLYNYSETITMRQLKSQTDLAAQGVETGGMEYLDDLVETDGLRITWISDDGTVLFESSDVNAQDMENHLEREEVKEAFAEGYGESRRFSSTFLENTYYSAKLLSDGSVLRLSVTRNSVFGLILGMMQPICVVLFLAALFSMFLAYRFSRRVVRPLNDVDLDHPEEFEGYDELSPLLTRIRSQQKELLLQKNELQKKEEELETILGNMTEGMILLGPYGKIISINPAAAEIIGPEYVSPGINILTVNRSLSFQNAVQNALNGTGTQEIVPFGSRLYQLNISPVLEQDEPKGAVAVLIDVTEREEAEEMRREFSANVSHELKTPLHSISGYAELMKNGMVREEDVRPFSEKIYAEAQRTIQLVEDIISLSRLDEGGAGMEFEETDLFEAACDAVETLRGKAEEAGVELRVTGEKTYVYGNPSLLQTVVQNLCDNSIKYNRPGGSVVVDVRKVDSKAQLTVSDTGIGIPGEDQKRIFERFYRVDKSHSRQVGGTGLGLSIVKHAVMIHHGIISVKSTAGEGTQITVTLPG